MNLKRKLCVLVLFLLVGLGLRAETVSFSGLQIDYPEDLIDSVSVGLGAKGDTMLFLASGKAGFRHDEIIINVSRSTAAHGLPMSEWQRQIESQLRKMDKTIREGDPRLKGPGIKRHKRPYPNAYVTYVARLSTSPCYYYTELRVLNDCLITICISAHHAEAYPKLLKAVGSLKVQSAKR